MQNIPFHITRLLVAYFTRTITSGRTKELDAWITASDANMKIFGECLKESLQPMIFEKKRDAIDTVTTRSG